MPSLFAMPTPEAVRQSARQGLFQRAASTAQAPRGRGFVQAASQAGGLFGEAIGRAAGGQAPGEAEAMKFQDVQAQIQKQFANSDLSDPKEQIKMMGESAKLLGQAGLHNQSAQAMQMANEIRKSIPETKGSKSPYAGIKVEEFTPESIKAFEASGNRSDLRVREEKNGKLGKQSKGQDAIDKEFAKTFVSWETGGKADVTKNLTQLKSVAQRLASGKENLTGAAIGRVPDLIKAATHPEAIDVRDQVEEVVQRNLREILGAQFTEKEGIRLIARAYNQNLDEDVNLRRVNRLIEQIQKGAEAKQASVDYFGEHDTLKGFKGKRFSIADIDKALDEEDAAIAKEKKAARRKGRTQGKGTGEWSIRRKAG